MMRTITLTTTDSTNRDAVLLAENGAEHGTAIIAHTQTEGRGRLGKSWSSPAGRGLYCSIIIRPRVAPENFPYLTFVAGLAVAESIRGTHKLEAGLKWPNDIYFNMRKCGGILTESSSLNGPAVSRYAVVGIGLNINTRIEDLPQELRSTATSLYIESGREVDIDTVFACIRSELLHRVAQFERQGFAPVLARWRQRDVLQGKRLVMVSVGGEIIEGISLGVDESGRLHLRDDQNRVHEILSGDIQLAK